MITINELREAIDRISPEKSAEPWDNCGIQINTGKESVDRILVCLEITKMVVEEAKRKQADIIITHHPLYFGAFKRIDNNEVMGNYTVSLIKSDISVYSAHTSFDKAPGGNNAKLCELLGLINAEPLFTGDGSYDYVGYTAEFPEEKTLVEIARLVSAALTLEPGELRYTGDEKKRIKKVGICSGAGADLVFDAADKGCGLFITGDVKYHEAQNAKERGIAIIDAGHFGTEKIFAQNMAEKLRSEIGCKAEILVSKTDINPFISYI